MNSEKISKLSKLALNAVVPKNRKSPSPADIQRYCTLLLSIASASLFCRNFEAARTNLAPLVEELPQTLAEDDIDMSHQMIDSHIIYARCLTEEKKMDEAQATLKKLISWLNKKVAVLAPRKIIASINRWRPELASSVNGMLWSILTAYQLKLVESNPGQFSVEELAQLVMLMGAHLCHTGHYEKAYESVEKANQMIQRLGERTAGRKIGGLQVLTIKAWILEGLAKKAKTPADKQAKLKECWDCLSAALNQPALGDESTQVVLMAKMAWIGQLLPDDKQVAALVASFTGDDGIKSFVEDPQLMKWGATLPGEMLTPYWGLSF